jgi:hypothetical protein
VRLWPKREAGPIRHPDLRKFIRHDRFEIPIDHPFAARFFVRNLLIAHSRRETIWATIARAMTAVGLGASALFGTKAVARPERDARVRGLCLLLREAGAIADLSPDVITLEDHGYSPRQKLVAFIFESDAARPGVLAKMCSGAEHGETLRREHEALGTVRAWLDENLRSTVPTPLALVRESADTAVAETILPGSPMYLAMRNSLVARRNVAEHFRLAREWLVRFQQLTMKGEAAVGSGDWGEFVVRPLAHYQDRYPAGSDEHSHISRILRKADGLQDARVPIVASHGDFWAGNLLVDGSYLGVVDWERFSERGSPFYDLFMFTTSYGLNYPWKFGRYAEPEEAFRATYAGNGWMHRLVRNHLHTYCKAFGLSPELLDVFLPAFLATRAIEESAGSGDVTSIGSASEDKRLRQSLPAAAPGKERLWNRLFQEHMRLEGQQTHRANWESAFDTTSAARLPR